MIVELFSNPVTWWLFGTAVIFTFVGKFITMRTTVDQVVAATIDSLIDEGYLKTRGSGKDMEILKWHEWNNEQTDRT
jgi:hypothetical protein